MNAARTVRATVREESIDSIHGITMHPPLARDFGRAYRCLSRESKNKGMLASNHFYVMQSSASEVMADPVLLC